MTNRVDRDILRRCIFRPYRKGMGPVFSLTVWDTHKTMPSVGTYTKDRLGYCLKMDGKILFEGEDFGNSPMHCVDSDNTVRSIMNFLTLRPGDTDKEYFDGYSEAQLAYCSAYAEALSWYCSECWHRPKGYQGE
jgi:hypothetical protein